MKLINPEIIHGKAYKDISSRDFRLYYVLRGTVQIRMEEETVLLENGEIYVLNPNENHSVDAHDGICADLSVSYSRVLQLMGYQRKLIVCNTHNMHNENTEELCRTLNAYLRAYYEADENLILQETLSLQLVYQLITHFSSNTFLNEEDERKNKVASYIEANYSSDLSLEEIAEEFGLTPQYFSRYFKTAFGTSFLKYLNQVRLQYAVDDLLQGSGTILRIAVNNGFANITSFNREFHEAYGMTPSRYREVYRAEREKGQLEDILPLLKEDEERSSAFSEIRVNMIGRFAPYTRFWNEILNVGSFEMMMKNHMMDQVSFLHKSLRFRKARLFLDTYRQDGNHHYYVSDAVMEFFVNIRMDLIIAIDLEEIYDTAAYISYFRSQCLRFAHRFGDGIQKHTVFEIVCSAEFASSKLKEYRAFYERIHEILKECRFETEIMGPGVLVDESGENFRRFVRNNPEIHTFTIFSAPFSVHKIGSEVFLNRLTDSGYLMEQFNTAIRVLQEENRPDAKVLLVAWKDRLNDVDVLNETSYMGARIIRNVLDGYGVLSSLPLDKPLDLMFEEASYGKTFNLLPGIMTMQGVLKPTYHALKLLDQQDRDLVHVSRECLITQSGTKGFLQILIHNCKRPGYRYYANETMALKEEYSPDLFEDTEPKTFRIILEGLDEGEYIIKVRSVNEENGNSFTAYLEMDYPDDSFIGHGEREYLRAASVIPMSGRKYTVDQNGKLEIECTLKMNEFRHLHLVKVID